jgi:hypothetical protein
LARFSQKAPAAIRVLLLACYGGRRQRPDNWRNSKKNAVQHQGCVGHFYLSVNTPAGASLL